MKTIFHEDFYQVYTTDPAAAQGRMEAIIAAVDDVAEFVTARPADEEAIEKLLSDTSKTKTMGEAAKQRIKREFSAKKQADEHLALYSQFMSG